MSVEENVNSLIEKTEAKFEKRLIEVKLDLIKWLVSLILAQTLTITGIFIGIIHLLK